MDQDAHLEVHEKAAQVEIGRAVGGGALVHHHRLAVHHAVGKEEQLAPALRSSRV